MSRIRTMKPLPPPGPVPRKNGKPPKPRSHRKMVKPVSDVRAQENQENDQIHENFMRYNGRCAWCGEPAEVRHHICMGVAGRAATLHDTDLQLALCGWCHDTVFHDKSVMPGLRALAIKFATEVAKYNRAMGTRHKMKDFAEQLDLTQ